MRVRYSIIELCAVDENVGRRTVMNWRLCGGRRSVAFSSPHVTFDQNEMN